ncbi:MAG: T9SS type A sorting domain-containing protein [Bacteroidetes bacterium]|nr:T9SS type A sorting domain-containing protein [Bacteroidota bacterium]
MKFYVLLFGCLLMVLNVSAQNFELVDRMDNYQSGINQLARIPLKIKNNTDKAQFYVIKKTKSDLGETQKGYFCYDNKCLEPSITEFSKKIEPGEIANLSFTIETGLQPSQNSIKFEIFPKEKPEEIIEQSVSILIDDRLQRSVFQSREITVNDIYPNPVQDQAVIEYRIYDNTKAKIVIHNVLGRSMGEYELPSGDTRIKFQVDDFAPGVYFYTLYVNNNGVMTRKMMVRK